MKMNKLISTQLQDLTYSSTKWEREKEKGEDNTQTQTEKESRLYGWIADEWSDLLRKVRKNWKVNGVEKLLSYCCPLTSTDMQSNRMPWLNALSLHFTKFHFNAINAVPFNSSYLNSIHFKWLPVVWLVSQLSSYPCEANNHNDVILMVVKMDIRRYW